MQWALLVDLDGVIIDTEEVWREAYRLIFHRANRYIVPEEELDRLYGLNSRQVVSELAALAGLKESEGKLLDEVNSHLIMAIESGAVTQPSAVEFLRRAAQAGAAICIVSSSPRIMVEAAIRATKLNNIVTSSVSGDETVNNKPHPEPYLKAVQIVGVQASRCIAIEDSPAGVASALSADLATICVRSRPDAWNERMKECVAIVPRLDIVDPLALRELVEGNIGRSVGLPGEDLKLSETVAENILTGIFEVETPWGGFRQFTHNQQTTVKVLTVEPDQMLSLQTHKKRDELWIILDAGLRVQVNDETWEPKIGEEIVIPRGSRHRLGSLGRKGRILEIAFGDFDETDINRLDDIYNRDAK